MGLVLGVEARNGNTSDRAAAFRQNGPEIAAVRREICEERAIGNGVQGRRKPAYWGNLVLAAVRL